MGRKVDKDKLGVSEEEEVGLFIVAFLLVDTGLFTSVSQDKILGIRYRYTPPSVMTLLLSATVEAERLGRSHSPVLCVLSVRHSAAGLPLDRWREHETP